MTATPGGDAAAAAGAVGGSGPRVVVVGAGGRMGTAACAALEAAPDVELVARVHRGDDALAVVSAARADVAVDLSVPAASRAHVPALVAAGVSVVVGTSGWDSTALEDLYATLADPGTPAGVGVLVAPSFALGAVLLMRFAAQAAPYFESVEVVESHHPAKIDAPSGTAVRTAELVAAARRAGGVASGPDATEHALEGARGARVAGVPVHSVRLRGVTASQEVLLGNAGEVLTLRHDAPDRSAFMPGLLLAVRQVRSRPGLAVGLENYLG